MSLDRLGFLFRREALEVYQRPFEADSPELLLPWRNWWVALAAGLILAAALVWARL